MIRKEGKHIAFGKGDIGIHMGCSSDVAMLMLRNLEKPLPVGELVNGGELRDTELKDTDIVMSFSNTESIDALMMCLKVIRKSLRTSSASGSKGAEYHE